MAAQDRLIGSVEFAAIDFESTGTSADQPDAPIQIGLAVMRDGEIEPDSLFRSFIQSDILPTTRAKGVHGIGSEDLRGAPTMLSLWPEFRSRLSDRCVVAHGAGTERRFLRAFPLHGFGPWVDTLAVARAAFPELPDHSLGAVLATLGLESEVVDVCSDLTWHDALFDAVASLVLLRHIIAASDTAMRPLELLLSPDRSAYYGHRASTR